MTTWAGWEADLLGAASLPQTASNIAFLAEWAKHTDSAACRFNPVDLTDANSGSHDCKPAAGQGNYYQAYTGRVWARTAFYGQITSGVYSYLRHALESGNPYTYANPSGVQSDLNKWYASNFATVWAVEHSGGDGGTVKAAHAHGGWNDLRRSVNHRMPAALRDSRHGMRAALRTVNRARKVRL